jgi:hypothetical protein
MWGAFQKGISQGNSMGKCTQIKLQMKKFSFWVLALFDPFY